MKKENLKNKQLRQFWKYNRHPITGYTTKKDEVINRAEKKEN